MHVGSRMQAVVVHGGRWTQLVRGVSGRANVRLCLASSFAFLAQLKNND